MKKIKALPNLYTYIHTLHKGANKNKIKIYITCTKQSLKE